jgi:uncharacterized protein YeaO (DUF488 family)
MPRGVAIVAVNEFLDRFILMKSYVSDDDDTLIRAPPSIEKVWRIALLYTAEYAQHCKQTVGFFVHHNPKITLSRCDSQRYADTLMLYKIKFGTPEPAIWPPLKAEGVKKARANYSPWLRVIAGFEESLAKEIEEERKWEELDARASGKKRSVSSDEKEMKVAEGEGEIVIFIKDLKGKTRTARMFPTQTVEELTHVLAAQDDMPVADQQRLLFCGKQMQNEKTLADYNIQQESTVHLVLRLKGC